jgi:PAS domain S-box-containing protein
MHHYWITSVMYVSRCYQSMQVTLAGEPMDVKQTKSQQDRERHQHKHSPSICCATGSDTQRLLILNLKRVGPAPLALTIDQKGKVLYATSSFCNLLGYNRKQIMHKALTDILPQPFSQLHHHWVKEAENIDGRTKLANAPCKTGHTVNLVASTGAQIPVSLDMKEIGNDGDADTVLWFIQVSNLAARTCAASCEYSTATCSYTHAVVTLVMAVLLAPFHCAMRRCFLSCPVMLLCLQRRHLRDRACRCSTLRHERSLNTGCGHQVTKSSKDMVNSGRRLSLRINSKGEIHGVAACKQPIFGFDHTALVGQTVEKVVDVFQLWSDEGQPVRPCTQDVNLDMRYLDCKHHTWRQHSKVPSRPAVLHVLHIKSGQ